MHIFMQLLRFSSDFTFTRKCKTAIEIGTPMNDICDNFLLFIFQKRTIASVPKICVYSNETQHTLTIALDVNNRGLEFIDKNGSLAHPSHKHFLQQLYSKDSDEFQIRKNVLRAVRLEAIYFLRPDICKFRLRSSMRLSKCSRVNDLQTRFTRSSFKGLPIKLAKCPFFYFMQNLKFKTFGEKT